MDIAGFYDGNEQRRTSEEVSYGEGWTSALDQHATYKCAWIIETGELYTVREPHPGGLLAPYLDEINVDQAPESKLTVEIIAVDADHGGLDALLSGWQDQVETDDSLAWLLERTSADGRDD